MQRIGILHNPLSTETSALADQLTTWLADRGISTWSGVSHTAREDPAQLAGCDLLLSLGGDGTILRAARLAIPNRIPLLPVAMGHLSFMAEVEPEAVFDVLEQIIAGAFTIEERTLVEVELERGGATIGRWQVLNEVLITRAEMVRAVVIDVLVDGAALTTYHADGVIIATATGSTAYALAAGGPILDPRTRSFLLVPVAPHLTSIPALVVHEDAVITLRLRSYYPTAVAIDAQVTLPLEADDIVMARRAQATALFARVAGARSFYDNLTQRLRRV